MSQTDATAATTTTPPASTDKKVWFNGELVPAKQASVSVFDHGLLYGDGVFEGIRIYNGRILKMATHLKRLEESARSILLKMPYDVAALEQGMRETMAANGVVDGYIRLCITRGPGTLGLGPDRCERPNVFVIADTIQLYPKELYEQGLEIITAATIRNHPSALSPRIKSMNYLNNIMAKVEAMQAGCVEALMLNHQGFVSECTGDNIFVVKDGELFTPPLHAGILEGITRNLVIELAQAAGITVHQVDMTRHDLYVADECFLTGTAAEVIAVVKLDGRPIGTGKPGAMTQQLLGSFRDLVADAPED